jgi:predicted enzyme related to lactoylglutathione lyase
MGSFRDRDEETAMPQMRSYQPGTPCWVDLSSPDPAGAQAFYGGLFGWDAHTIQDPATGGYTFFTMADTIGGTEGHELAAVMSTMDETQPPAWTTYVSVVDVDATAKKVLAVGGAVLVEPMDVMGQGRMAIFADDQGAVLGVWQPLAFHGAGFVDDPNTYCWSELACRDIDKAKTFYGEVFGWRADTHPFGSSTYTEWKLSGPLIGGMIQMDARWPDEVPPHWMVYFAVEDCDASVERAGELGGTVSIPPTDIPPGRFAVLGDPSGAFFAVIELAVEPASL